MSATFISPNTRSLKILALTNTLVSRNSVHSQVSRTSLAKDVVLKTIDSNKDIKSNKEISYKEDILTKKYIFIANYGYVVERACLYTIIILTVIGLIMFLGEKKLEFGKKFKWKDFLFLKPQCKRYPINHSFIELFTAAFKKV